MRHVNRNPYKTDWAFVGLWLAIFAVNLILLGVIIWAIVTLVTYFTSGAGV